MPSWWVRLSDHWKKLLAAVAVAEALYFAVLVIPDMISGMVAEHERSGQSIVHMPWMAAAQAAHARMFELDETRGDPFREACEKSRASVAFLDLTFTFDCSQLPTYRQIVDGVIRDYRLDEADARQTAETIFFGLPYRHQLAELDPLD